jgi:hypothetical protein
MQRRTIVSGAALGLLTLMTACGGEDERGEPTATSNDGVNEHVDGAASLPRSVRWDLAALAQPTPGAKLAVQVLVGALPAAGASVQVYDIEGVLLDSGTTDANGRYVSGIDGRCFMHAVAQVAGLGTLHGFELNTIGKTAPVIDVNLLPTVFHRLQERHALSAEGAEFLVKRVLDIDDSRLLSDAESVAAEFDQEAMRHDLVASGRTLADYVDSTVDAMMEALNRGLNAPASADYRVRLQRLSASPDCSVLPQYDGGWDDQWEDATLATIKRLAKNHWVAATQAVASFAFKKIADVTGYAVIGPVGETILNQLLPTEPNPTQVALDEIQNQLRVLTSQLQKVLERFDIADFTRNFEAVRTVFNKFDAIASDMAETQSYYARHALATDDNYRQLVLTRCQQMFALETELTEAENRFLGLKAFAGAGVLNHWFTVFEGKPFYTAQVQQQYMDLLNYYVGWMLRIYSYLINAYTASAATSGVPVSSVRLGQLSEQLVAKITLVESMRPPYLLSEKQVFDIEHGLLWVGRCNLSTSYSSFLPDDYDDGHYKARVVPNLVKMQYEEDNPCRERMLGSPLRDSSIRADLVDAFAWRLPTVEDLECSFGQRIRQKYGKKHNLATFKYDFYIPASFELTDLKGKPLNVIVRNGIHTERVRVARGIIRYYLWLTAWGFEALGKGSFPNHPSYNNFSYHYFPVATVPFDRLYKLLPWKVYADALVPKPSV